MFFFYILIDTFIFKIILKGYRVRVQKDHKYRIVSTPLLDIIEHFPLIAGKLFYRMMVIER